ncbi:protein stoned-B-like isoform X2 [Centruroides sculpturatus]|uniref:protein stoned-B-like isoform X2 n=2 Tax=Centruroides sculpturatus TaxID=218467 RepID=UPI000C6E0076|nr:protein stoned-B-like isoform X2 [Centruroides sculpturatus]
MNFIKKKIKSHKKGLDKEDDFENIPHETTSTTERNSEEQQSNKNTEEWQFFQQLTQRVQDTVEKTQTTLTKLKDSSAIAELNKPDYLSDSDENESKVLPSVAQSWVHFEDDTNSTLLNVDSSLDNASGKPPPPRPPPPKLIETNTVKSTDKDTVLNEDVTKISETPNQGVSLLDEFGFQADTASIPQFSAQLNINDLLALEENEEQGPDPFDTSFVDTSNTVLKESSFDELGKETLKEEHIDKEPDPFDTSFVNRLGNLEIADNDVSKEDYNFTLEKKIDGGINLEKNEIATPVEVTNIVSESVDINGEDTMSNPFLSDSDTQPSGFSKALFDIDSQSNDLFGVSKPKSTTNPFESDTSTQDIDLLGDAFATSLEDKSSLEEKPSVVDQCLFDPFGFGPEDNLKSNDAELIQPVQQDLSKKTQLPSEQFDFLTKQPEVETSSVNLLEKSLDIITNNAPTDDLFSSQSSTLTGQNGIVDINQKRDSIKSIDKNAITSPEQNVHSRSVSEAVSLDEISDAEKSLPPGSRKMSTAMEELDDFFGGGISKSVAQTVDVSTTITKENRNKIESDPFANIFEGSEITKDTEPSNLTSVTDVTKECVGFDMGEVKTASVPSSLDDLMSRSDAPSVLNPFETSVPAQPSDEDSTKAFDPFGGFMDSDTKTDTDLLNTTTKISDSFTAVDTFSSDSKLDDAAIASAIADPFDTSMMKPEIVKDAIPFTETAAFEAFAAKFEEAIEKLDDKCVTKDEFDPFGVADFPDKIGDDQQGFGGSDSFDPFLSMTKPPENTPTRLPPQKETSQDSFDDDEGPDFSVVIRPKMKEKIETTISLGPPPVLPPPPKTPPKSPVPPVSSKFNPFDVGFDVSSEDATQEEQPAVIEQDSLFGEAKPQTTEEITEKKQPESLESPTTPLFDEDTSQPLEEFPAKFEGEGWEMMLRQPNKKKITGNRFWKKVYVRLSDGGVLQLFNKSDDNDPFQELPLQACYSLSEIGAQQFDAYGKIFTVKLQYIFYRERVGVRPGQISKVMQGHITSVGQIAKLGLPLEHAPQVSQLLKLGTQCYSDIKTFVQIVEDALFHLTIHRDRSLTYKTEEVQVTVQDEFYVYQDKTGHVCKQLARVRIFFLAFITGMPDVEIGLNDLTRQGKEVVGRYDIIPVVTEEWIRLENCEFHSCVLQEEFENNRIIKFHPPDACLFELMRFRIRPPKNRELPLQVKAVMLVTKARIELRTDVLVPGYHGRKHGQIPCEDIQIRFPIPECWIYLFRVEKHFRYGSLKAAARKPGKIKGLERIMGTAQSLDPSLIEVSTGNAKYEHALKAVVWRIPRLPKEGQGAYTTHLFLLRLDMTSFDQIPESLSQHVDVEFTMPATTVSHTTVRSVSVTNSNPPEKYVRYVSKHEYKVEIEFTESKAESEYVTAAATTTTTANIPPTLAETPSNEHEDDDSD